MAVLSTPQSLSDSGTRLLNGHPSQMAAGAAHLLVLGQAVSLQQEALALAVPLVQGRPLLLLAGPLLLLSRLLPLLGPVLLLHPGVVCTLRDAHVGVLQVHHRQALVELRLDDLHQACPSWDRHPDSAAQQGSPGQQLHHLAPPFWRPTSP